VTLLPSNSRQATGDLADKLLGLAREAARQFAFDRALEYLATVEARWQRDGMPEYHAHLRLELLREKGRILSHQGKVGDAVATYQLVLDICRASDRLAIKADTLTQIGQLLGKHGDYDRALGFHQRAIGAFRRLNDTVGLCKALRNLGVIYVELGEFEEAQVTYDEAIMLASQANEETLYADLVNNLGTILNMKGDWEKALDLYRESLGIYRSGNEIRKAAYTMNNLAITYADRGMIEEALQYFVEAGDIAEEIKDGSLGLIVHINLADIYLKVRELELAKIHCKLAEAYFRENGVTNGHLVETLTTAGKIAFRELQFERALQYFNDAVHLAGDIGTRFQEAEVLFQRGTLFDSMGKHFEALADLEQAYKLFTQAQAEGKKSRTKEAIGSIEELYLKVFDSMAQKVDAKDEYTKGHSDRVASFALLLARELGMETASLKTIVAGALLHDIGKVEVDDAVLKKSGQLTELEYKEIQRHCEYGVQLLADKEFPWDVKPLIRHHHEKLDGSGYPQGLRGDEIPLGARIIGVADVFDALTSDRVYRQAFTPEKALSIMRDDVGRMFDPVLFERFEQIVHDGRADRIINSRTDVSEMYSIWMRCLSGEEASASEPRLEPEAAVV